MTKALIIAEKPSVARDIVSALGGFSRIEPNAALQVWESPDYICTHAIGHLLELYEPEDYQASYKLWRMNDLPIVPLAFMSKPKAQTITLLKTIRQLMGRPDISLLINACDAGREGELIFRELFEYARTNKPTERVWLQSMTPESIRCAFASAHRKPGATYDGLAAAGKARSQVDWLFGMNLSRAVTLKLDRSSQGAWAVGRVQTPTLALLVERELKIQEHKASSYYQLKAIFDANGLNYEGLWCQTECEAHQGKPTKLPIQDELIKIQAQLSHGGIATAKHLEEEKIDEAPMLFSLNSLQQYMARHHHWSAKRTLTVAQKCYEHHKVLTYPRTDSNALPCDYKDSVLSLLHSLTAMPDYKELAKELLTASRPWPYEHRVFDDASVSDHFAIIPTGLFPARLPEDESILFDAVIRRLLAALLENSVSVVRRTISQIESHFFVTQHKTALKEPGWKRALIHLKNDLTINAPTAPYGEALLLSTEISEGQTKPPPRIGEGQLLRMMEKTGQSGLGTPATRADIIESLKQRGYVTPSLEPLPKGMMLIDFLSKADVKELTSPALTCTLEANLEKVQSLTLTRELYLDEATQALSVAVLAIKASAYDPALSGYQGAVTHSSVTSSPRVTWGVCPIHLDRPCNIVETKQAFMCETRLWALRSQAVDQSGVMLPKTICGKSLRPDEIRSFMNTGKTSRLDGLKSKAGREFSAFVVRGPSGSWQLEF
jgi:DNA topoisomerase-3